MPKKQFLVACTRLYKPLCWSVGPSVCLSVRRSVDRSPFARRTRLMAIGLVIINFVVDFPIDVSQKKVMTINLLNSRVHATI